MGNTYIKFSDSSRSTINKKKQGVFKTLVKWTLMYFIPVGNPTFEDKIDDVAQWLVEFENDGQYPTREIGLDIHQQPIMIMPWRKNYGYWVDNNLLLPDFKTKFKAIEIAKEEFENFWQQFRYENKDF